MLVKTYALEIKETNIKANLIDPGIVRTEMRAQAFPGEDPKTLPEPKSITNIFVKVAEENFSGNGEILGL